MAQNQTLSHRSLIALFGVMLTALVAAGCGGDEEVVAAGSDDAASETTVADTAGAEPSPAELAAEAIAAAKVGIADKEADIGEAALGQLDFADENPDVCPDEFATFNVVYPEDPDEVAALDEGIEARGQAVVECLYEAGQPDLAEDLALLSAWSRHLADQGS